jgi:hypothetical protein
MEVSFWKEKYYTMDDNIIDFELENQLLKSKNKSLIDSQRR